MLLFIFPDLYKIEMKGEPGPNFGRRWSKLVNLVRITILNTVRYAALHAVRLVTLMRDIVRIIYIIYKAIRDKDFFPFAVYSLYLKSYCISS